ncbi:MAG TPA: endonuclease [Mycobacterium sp.]|nr:endonuclease [Mycobacterium sp.]
MGDNDITVRRLLDAAGKTYADEAGIRLRNEPMPLFQLLTLAMLASKPIGAEIATKAARELFEAGIRTPDAVLDADRASVLDAFGRAGYARYDESSATRLSDMATMTREQYHGDLRELAAECKEDAAAARQALQRFKGIGATGAGIFLREVQDVWPWARPYFDERALSTAGELELPTTPEELGKLAPRTTARLAAALVRVSLSPDLHDQVLEHKE